MKKQSHVSSKKPNNSTLSSEDHLAEKPKKGTYREPNSKKIDGEKFLAKDHKLTHIKEFSSFNENQSVLTDEEKSWLEDMIEMADEFIVFKSKDTEMRDSIFSKLGIGTKNNNDNWDAGSGY
jgi:predicted helicase